MFKLLFLPFRLLRLLLRVTGVRGGLLLAIGVGIGLLIAPRKGAELRADLQARLAGTDADPVAVAGSSSS